MKRLTTVLFLTLVFASCKADNASAPTDPANAEAPQWTAEVSDLDSTTDAGVEVKAPGAADFAPWRGGQPIPPKSVVRTPKTVRATLALPHAGKLTLNHSSIVELAEDRRISLTQGQAVLEYPPGEKDDVTVVLPTGEVILHGTKVALVAGENDSTVTVSQGLVEVRHKGESFEGRAGHEIVLYKDRAPLITAAPDLGRRIGWSELGDSARDAAVAAVPRGLGKLVGKVPGGETEHRLDLVNHKVHVKIQGNLAYTEITESFKNPVGQTLEGVYRFPLPSDARISRLALKVGNKIMEGEFLETAHAERIWRDVIEQWRDPAMLKWKEGNTFELRIFPIDPHQTREVTIGYVQRLAPSASGYTYTYPMPVDRAGLIPAKRFEFEGELYGHDPTQALELLGYAGEVATGATEADKAFAKISFTEDDFIARGDLSVRFGRRDAGGLRTYTYTEPKKDSFAVMVVRPDLPMRKQTKPRDFVVVLDKSLSRTGAALDIQKRLVPRMIREMDALDRVAVIACNEKCEALAAEFAAPRLATADAVETALVSLEASGATYPVEAIRVAADLFRRRDAANNDREAHVVYFTDGVASVGELRPGKASDAVQRILSPFDARMSIVDVGGNNDTLMLSALASAGRGRVVTLDPMISMTGQALDILNAHYRDVLERPTLALPPGVTAESALPTAIAAGDELVIAARYTGSVSGDIVLSGTLNGADYVLRYPVNLVVGAGAGNRFVPGEWAAQRIEALELAPGDSQKEIVSLSKTYGVLSRYTTLLALESKEMMDEFGVRAQDRTQWTGGEMDDEAAEESSNGPSTSSRTTATPKPSAPKAKKMAPRKDSMHMGDGGGNFFDSTSAKSMDEAEPSSPQDSLPDVAARPEERGRLSQSAPRPMPDSKFDLDQNFAPQQKVARRGRGYYRRPQRRLVIDAARPLTSYERNNEARLAKAFAADSTNRSKRMGLIRARVRADMVSAARSETRDWLATNPMDPEAIVQMAQLAALDGDLSDFYVRLIAAADAAPRGRWLQERIAAAAKAQGDEAMACAFDVALESTEKRPPKAPADILACPMTTAVGTWFGEPGPTDVPQPPDTTRLSGGVVVKLTSKSGDWDIMLLEPSGRPLWWGSARQRLKFSNVVGTDRTEVLALPSLRSGTYSVRAIPRTGKAGDVLEFEISGSGGSKKLSVTAPSAASFEAAEFEYRY